MKILKKFLIILSSILLLTGLCGCTDKNESAEEIMKKSFEAQKNIKSMSSSIDFTLSMTSDNTPIDIKVTGSIDLITKPSTYKADLTINLSSIINLNVISYAKQEGNEYNVYTGIKIGDQITWEKDTTTVPKINEFSSSVDKDYYINQIVKIVNYQLVGKEKLNGKNTYHIIGSISHDGLVSVLNTLGLYEQLEEDEKETFDLLLSVLDDLKVDTWINTDNYLNAKAQVDATEFIKSVMGLTSEATNETSGDFSKAFLTITFDNYNNIDNIEIPQEALDAKEGSGYEALLG